MIDRTLRVKPLANQQRRKVLQGVAAVVVAGVTPKVTAGLSKSTTTPNVNLSGKLVCNITDPVKTLVLSHNSNQTMVLNNLSKSALMFDGSIVDCNNAFCDQPVVIPANQEIQIRFKKRHTRAIAHRVEDYQRVQSRVTRLSDGTRVIPFTATVKGSSAVFL